VSYHGEVSYAPLDDRRAARFQIARGFAVVAAVPALLALTGPLGSWFRYGPQLLATIIGGVTVAWGTREIVIGLVAHAVAAKRLYADKDQKLPPARLVD
jgi:hypothetical protein